MTLPQGVNIVLYGKWIKYFFLEATNMFKHKLCVWSLTKMAYFFLCKSAILDMGQHMIQFLTWVSISDWSVWCLSICMCESFSYFVFSFRWDCRGHYRRVVGFTTETVRGYSRRPTRTHYLNSEPTNLCSFSIMLRAYRSSNTFQFYSFGVDPISRLEHTIYRTRG